MSNRDDIAKRRKARKEQQEAIEKLKVGFLNVMTGGMIGAASGHILNGDEDAATKLIEKLDDTDFARFHSTVAKLFNLTMDEKESREAEDAADEDEELEAVTAKKPAKKPARRAHLAAVPTLKDK